MNIAILNHYASVPEVGSAETRHFELAKRFVREGHRVDIYIGDFSHLTGKRWSETYGWSFSKDGVDFIVVETREYTENSLSRLLSSIDYYRNGRKKIIQSRYDVIIASSPHPFSWSLGWYYVKRKGGKFFIEIRDVWPDDLVELGSLSYRHPVSKLFDHMCKKYYPKADGIISLVPDLSNHFNRLKVRPKNFIYIPNGVDLKIFKDPEPCPAVDELFSKVPADKMKVVYAGSIVEHKGIKEFIEALSKVNKNLRDRFVFFFVGASQADYLVSVKETAKDLQNVFFFDPVPKRCVPYLLQKADVLLFTLSQTVMDHPAVSSYKVVDYMASGKPVLCVDIENLPFKKTKGAVFFRKDNLEEALRKILLEDLSELGRRNREYVVKERDWGRLYEKLRSFVLS